MMEKDNSGRNLDNDSSVNTSREDKIKAIKARLQSNFAEEYSDNKVESVPENKDLNENLNNVDTSNDWESDMAERIAKRVKRLKNPDNNELDDILNSVDQDKLRTEDDNPDALLAEGQPSVSHQKTEDSLEKNQSGASINTYNASDTSVPDMLPEVEINENAQLVNIKKKKIRKKKTLKERLLSIFPNNKDSLFEKCRKMIFIASITAIICCGAVVADYYIDTISTENGYQNIMNDYADNSEVVDATVPTNNDEPMRYEYLMLPKAETLYNINNDVVGVINIPDTDIFYPVLQYTDNNKYIDTDIYGKESRAGAIFIDFRNVFDKVVDGIMQENSEHIVAYGHEMSGGKMFGLLKNYKDNYSYYSQHPIIEFNSNYFEYKYKIFAVCIIDCEDKTDTAYDYWNKFNFVDDKDFYNFVNEAKKRTIINNDVDVEYGDQLLTLSTCNGIFGKGGSGRLIVMARRVRDGEDLLEGTQESSKNTNIKWPSIYYDYNGGTKYDENAEFVPYG